MSGSKRKKNMRRIAVLTSSRADLVPLKYVIEQLEEKLGNQCCHVSFCGPYDNEYLWRTELAAIEPDIALLLGDRYETLIGAAVAAELGIPIAHISGGEETRGATDNAFRHAITKLAYWHFVANDECGARVVQMGEHPDRIFVVGDPQIDSIALEPYLSQEQCQAEIEIKFKSQMFLVVYHPETLSTIPPLVQVNKLLDALRKIPGTVLLTGCNADRGGDEIKKALREYDRPDTFYRQSYHPALFNSLLRGCNCLIGNSSAGVIQAPAMGKASVNIGDRQYGRHHQPSVWNASCNVKEILEGIKASADMHFEPTLEFGVPGKVSPAIVENLLNFEIPATPQKDFYNVLRQK